MGIFDSIVAQAEGALSSTVAGSHPGLMDEVSGLIRGDGLQNLIAAFREKGLGDAVASWIGTGQNHSISAEQLQSVLGSDKVQAIAQKFGLSAADASGKLASLLPQVIDKLTPNGQQPEGHLLEQGIALLKGFGGQA